MEYITLRNNIKIPQLGFGVFQIPPENTKEAVLLALKNGYRHIDTAQAYFNEKEVGEAIKESNIPREELFITTKIWISDYGYEQCKKAFEESLNKLGLEYIDLYLIHQNIGDVYGTWRAMEELYNEGKVKAIGVSNFTEDRFVSLAKTNEIAPMINQIEVHPFFQQEGITEFYDKYGCKVEAWGPLAEGKNDIFNNPILKEIADKYQKSVAQVILRWHIQRGIIIFPKSTKPERVQENIDIFDFELEDEDMTKIKELETNVRIAQINDPSFVEYILSF